MQVWQLDIATAIRDFVLTSPLGRLQEIDGSPIWDEPLVGFADGDDPLFEFYHEVVGDFHLTPREALGLEAAALGRDPAGQWPHVSVVAWVLPIAAATRASNRAETEGASQRWNHTRFQGEAFNNALRRHVIGALAAQGYLATAPVLSPDFGNRRGPSGLASPWSERHMAYAAGLGTFSLSDGLITAKGIAHRCGSVVVNAAGEATPRPYAGHQAYCLYYQGTACRACIDRCPAGAITPAGHDKDKCYQHVNVTLAPWARKPGYMGDYAACGLCQVGVPCESRIPGRARTRRSTSE